MPIKLEFPQEQIVKRLETDPRCHGDFWTAQNLMIHERDEAARKSGAAAESKTPDVPELSKDERRLAVSMPQAIADVQDAQAAAEAAKQRADELLAARLEVLNTTEVFLKRIGLLGYRKHLATHLVRTPAQLSEIGNATILAFVEKFESPCDRATSLWQSHLQDLTHTEAISKFVPAFVKKVQSEISPLVSELKAFSIEHSVDISAVLASLVKSDGTVRKYANVGAFDDLI